MLHQRQPGYNIRFLRRSPRDEGSLDCYVMWCYINRYVFIMDTLQGKEYPHDSVLLSGHTDRVALLRRNITCESVVACQSI